ncbi:hypothetical protein [Nocardia sp. NBC_01388]|uniref:hypothetical protein n=1 Tax=Nocardia sp. NBC_01388 TaxID=2903596 RepID=UPI003246424F
MTEPCTGQMNVFLPKAMTPAGLDAAIRLNVEAALARTWQQLVIIERGLAQESSPGVLRWPVTYTVEGTRRPA